ncbi:MAG: hypothetical protein D6736_05590 [Nitrospinota bacterium]|nr:MAG: hypothetical protein D6736_05590 [Nitrospinota bacterium]
MSAIANTTVVSNFAGISQLNLLHRLYGTLYLPLEVYEEIQVGLEEGYLFYADIDQWIYPFAEDGWIRLVSMIDEQELRLFGTLLSRLHRGEAACLTIAKHRGWLLLTDDRAARHEATRLDVLFSGSVGCLVMAVENNLCPLEQANSWLSEMIQRGYWSPVTDLTVLLKQRP